jgi:hypothetical protein
MSKPTYATRNKPNMAINSLKTLLPLHDDANVDRITPELKTLKSSAEAEEESRPYG